MAEIQLEGVTKVYPGGVHAVEDLSLSVGDQEFMVLVGPSGCGKTTALRLVAGLEDVSAGVIRLGGEVVNDVAPKDRDIAMVFQHGALYPHMTVYRNLAFGLGLRADAGAFTQVTRALFDREAYRAGRERKRTIRRKVEETADLLGIRSLLGRRPRALSGGERQRVALGRAIVREPQAFLFDEPLSHLDAKLRVEMRTELRRLHRTLRTTTLFVTHDQEEAMTLGNRIALMNNGRLQQCGPPLELYHRPVNRFVAGFVGMPPMNFLGGRLSGGDEGLYFDHGGLRLRLNPPSPEALAPHVGQEVVLGVRPEGISDRPADSCARTSCTINAAVTAIEPLGEKMDVYLETRDGVSLVSRVDATRPIREGQQMLMYVNTDRVHVFEPGEVGRNLSLVGNSRADSGERSSG